jgi:hypothetical protein
MPLLRVGCVLQCLQQGGPQSCLLSTNPGTSHIETLNVRLAHLSRREAPYTTVLLRDGNLIALGFTLESL